MNADRTEFAFATSQITGDQLDPAAVTTLPGLEPTFSIRKGQRYSGRHQNRECVGRTGVWKFSTERLIPSGRVEDHLTFLGKLMCAKHDQFGDICDFVREQSDWAGVSCFWVGPAGAPEPSVPYWSAGSAERSRSISTMTARRRRDLQPNDADAPT